MMDSHKCHDWGMFIIRVGLAAVFLTHGISKFNHLDGTIMFFAKLGLPSFVAYLVAAVETLGGLSMLTGLFTKWFGYALSIVMIVAIALAKSKAGFMGGFEFEFTLLTTAFGVAMVGPGHFCVPMKKIK